MATYAPVGGAGTASSASSSHLSAVEASDQEGFDSNIRCAGFFAIAVAVIVIANFFLNQLQVASTNALAQATYDVFSQRAATTIYFATFEMYDMEMDPLIADMELNLGFVSGTLKFTNDTCAQPPGACSSTPANNFANNWTPYAIENQVVRFTGTGSLIQGHFWNLNFQAQAIAEYSAKNTEPSCPKTMRCFMV